MKDKLTLNNLIVLTVISLILTAVKLILDDKIGNWVSPSDVKFWANDIALIIAWILFFLQRKRR